MSVKTQQLESLLEPVVTSMDYEFVGLEYISQGRHSILRIYVDSENGITVDDCANVSHQLSAVLDVEDPIPGEYSLEVSSPGLERPLFRLAHYERFIGAEVKFRTSTPVTHFEDPGDSRTVKGRRKFRGQIKAVTDDAIVFVVDGKEIMIALKEIDKANLVVDF